MAIEYGDDCYPKNLLSTGLKKRKRPNFSLEEHRNTHYAALTDLNLPIYITTNYDQFMEEALGSRGKNPVSEFCRWNDGLKVHVLGAGTSSLFDRDSRYNLSDGATPLVYHLYGDMDIRASMVLTKKDYIDFIINLNRETRKQYSHLLSVKH